jgi:hypothetical protein
MRFPHDSENVQRSTSNAQCRIQNERATKPPRKFGSAISILAPREY